VDALDSPCAEFLRQIPDELSDLSPPADNIETSDRGLPFGWYQQSTENPHQGTLPRAIGTQQAEQTTVDFKVNAIQGPRSTFVIMTNPLDDDPSIS